jgi:hypothetical protein
MMNMVVMNDYKKKVIYMVAGVTNP